MNADTNLPADVAACLLHACVCVCAVALEGMEMWVVAPRLIPSVFFVSARAEVFFRIY